MNYLDKDEEILKTGSSPPNQGKWLQLATAAASGLSSFLSSRSERKREKESRKADKESQMRARQWELEDRARAGRAIGNYAQFSNSTAQRPAPESTTPTDYVSPETKKPSRKPKPLIFGLFG